MKPFTRTGAFVVLAIALVGGCKQGPSEKLNTSAAPVPQQMGWTTYELGTLSISAPHNYRQTPIKPRLILGDEQPDPPPPPLISVPLKEGDGLVFTLYHQEVRGTADERPTRMELYRESGHTKMAEAAEEVMKGQSEETYQTIDLPIGKAGLVKTTEKSIGGDEISRVYYVVVHDGHMYKFVWETYSFGDGIAREAEAIMPTLRFKP